MSFCIWTLLFGWGIIKLELPETCLSCIWELFMFYFVHNHCSWIFTYRPQSPVHLNYQCTVCRSLFSQWVPFICINVLLERPRRGEILDNGLIIVSGAGDSRFEKYLPKKDQINSKCLIKWNMETTYSNTHTQLLYMLYITLPLHACYIASPC